MSTFFSRPNLSDLSFKQTPTSELSLSGQTRIKNSSGLTLSDGAAGDVIVTASGASTATTQGHVLTYYDGSITLRPSGGGSVIFDTDRFTTRDGIPEVCVGGDNTINNFIEGYFFPAVGPSASLSASNNERQFGDDDPGTLSYEAIRNTYQIDTISIDANGDGTTDQFPVTTPITGDCCGTQQYTFGGSCAIPPSGTTETNITYCICVETVCNQPIDGCTSVDTVEVTWRNKKYYFLSNTKYESNDALTLQNTANGLSGSQAVLTTDKSANLSLTFNNEFFYYMYPTTFGTPTFVVNGLPNNAWGNSDIDTLFKIDFTNSDGYLNQYYVARSDNRITGSYTIGIS